ncbi:hypothetical protein GCM10009092_13340 [Bowmanella denitrificans]|uniref:Uncharacterized protein n=1 Tax=Bowmanella denitrificans TaxID=366582 RepID=A0ABN0WZ83_9ALTE|nr:hypothetical protein [Bowmanella denitrificans]
MLKAYAIAIALTTATPVADKAAEGAKAPVKSKAETTQTLQAWKPRSVRV